LVQVSLSLNIHDYFTYEYRGAKNTLKKGLRVVVPVGNRYTTGWIVNTNSEYNKKVKPIIGIIEDSYLPDTNYIKFAEAVSYTYFVSQGKILDMSLSPQKKSVQQIYLNFNSKTEKLNKFSFKELQSISKKEPILFFYKKKCESESIQDNSHSNVKIKQKNSFLLNYERIDRYRKIIQSYSSKGLCVLITVPDNLTADYFKQQLNNCDTYHSKMKINERENLWCDCIHGKVNIMVGGLSAVLLPIKNLGCIISERSGSFLYKKTSFSDFNVRHLASLRAKQFKLPFVEGFSTYTSEIFLNKKQLLIEDTRTQKEVVTVVRRLPKKEPGIPSALLELLKKNYLDKKKILVVINRKNSSQYLFCQKCKKIQYCRSCSGVLNINDSGIACSKCGFTTEKFSQCSICNTELVAIKDISISSLKELIKKQLTEKGIKTLTAEDLFDVNKILDQLKSIRIVIATPIILNPFFKDIFDSIIYFRPESIFGMNEYSTGEMIFSMVSDLKELIKDRGTIDIFSVFHFHYSLKLIKKEAEFFNRELKYRKWFFLPPYCNVYNLEIRSESLKTLGSEMRKIYSDYKEKLNIKRIYLLSRKKSRGKFKGHIEIHTKPQIIKKSDLLKNKNIGIKIISI